MEALLELIKEGQLEKEEEKQIIIKVLSHKMVIVY